MDQDPCLSHHFKQRDRRIIVTRQVQLQKQGAQTQETCDGEDKLGRRGLFTDVDLPMRQVVKHCQGLRLLSTGIPGLYHRCHVEPNVPWLWTPKQVAAFEDPARRPRGRERNW